MPARTAAATAHDQSNHEDRWSSGNSLQCGKGLPAGPLVRSRLCREAVVPETKGVRRWQKVRGSPALVGQNSSVVAAASGQKSMLW